MLSNPFRWVLAFYREDGTAVGQQPLAVDWEPACEAARFAAVRRGQLPAGALARETVLEPLWHRELGEPYVGGFRVRLSLEAEGDAACELSSAYFREAAQRAAAGLVEAGELADGAHFRYVAAAFPQPTVEAPPARFAVRELSPALPLREGSLAALLASAARCDEPRADDPPAFLPRQALAEAAELALTAGAKETGGVLIGHLRRDPGLPEVFLDVTAQLPAREAEGELTKLTFSARTWTAVQAAIDLRRQGEIMLGWWHSHPVREWCKECAPEKQRTCHLAAGFLSAHDRALHRTVFPRAYSVALVVNVVADGPPTFSLFGWRDGLLEPRGYHLQGLPAVEEASAGAQGAHHVRTA